MLQSKLFAKTLYKDPKDEVSVNAKLLSKGAFVYKLMSGVYQYMPLGVRVLTKIENIIRDEMNRLGAGEILMPALHPSEVWEKTGRFHSFEALFKVVSHFDKEYALAPTHEEAIVPLVARTQLSYKDFPFSLYQIQTKFRDEPRAKSGLLRGREFRMKDLYSFHLYENSLDEYYANVADCYMKIFSRIGLDAVRVRASGGTFSEYSDEFQVLAEAGEDLIFISEDGEARNGELFPQDLRISKAEIIEYEGKKWSVKKGIEIGNIFKLYDKYSRPFELTAKTEDGSETPVLMGCYGMGTSRIMGTIAEIMHDSKGIIWPEEVSPFSVHLLLLSKEEKVKKEAFKTYEVLKDNNIDVLFDEREDKTAGEKFSDSDLIGITRRVVVSDKTFDSGKLELKLRNEKKEIMTDLENLVKMIKQ